jgi:hypothetical protein
MIWHLWLFRCVLVMLTVLVLSGCRSGGGNSLVGDYATRAGGSAEFRIKADGARFVLEAKVGDAWREDGEMVSCTEADYTGVFGSDASALKPVGLKAAKGSFMVFAVSKGAKAAGHEFTTGYYIVASLLMQGDVYKLP